MEKPQSYTPDDVIRTVLEIVKGNYGGVKMDRLGESPSPPDQSATLSETIDRALEGCPNEQDRVILGTPLGDLGADSLGMIYVTHQIENELGFRFDDKLIREATTNKAGA